MFRAVILLSLLSLAACSSDDSAGGGSGTQCKALTDLCERLPVAEVESACGSGYDVISPIDTSGGGPVNTCGYQKNVSSATEHNVVVVYRCLESFDAHQYFLDLQQPDPTAYEVVSGVGDEAAFHSQGANGATLDARKGQKVVSVGLSYPAPAPCTNEQAKAAMVAIAAKTLALAE
ncbi:MAG: hypothetical protein IPM35_35420 [Myxococcales bacterium]|nr:hypothetical protein [Myxococcales bacterium]